MLTACCILVDNLGQAVRTQHADGLLADLLQGERFLRVYVGEFVRAKQKFAVKSWNVKSLSTFSLPITTNNIAKILFSLCFALTSLPSGKRA